jgi:hypothetical protein
MTELVCHSTAPASMPNESRQSTIGAISLLPSPAQFCRSAVAFCAKRHADTTINTSAAADCRLCPLLKFVEHMVVWRLPATPWISELAWCLVCTTVLLFQIAAPYGVMNGRRLYLFDSSQTVGAARKEGHDAALAATSIAVAVLAGVSCKSLGLMWRHEGGRWSVKTVALYLLTSSLLNVVNVTAKLWLAHATHVGTPDVDIVPTAVAYGPVVSSFICVTIKAAISYVHR